MFSQTAEYALRAAVTLAEAGESLSTAQLAGRTQVPAQYLSKVLQQLHRAGLLQALRGKYGGYRLARPPQDITILDVVNAVDPLQRIRHCPLGRPAHAHALCPLHRQMDQALAQIEQTLGAQTLAAMLELGQPGPELLHLGQPVADG
ncbi:transcriptional regulator, BadM/Rrf2 family (plasmid) [Deinococcus proteolyticus MRP]|uniref:Transcriptional regulator, BadM/Rrf2 family n=1 Tax=Deinococcus proteolyticus (strain ATCC 35074 / DSM 20540 / JCM 6276 / NBRC 101906 / NCIMB 13154 / VKM Ac-1939 / CCM 2703 / MRP) TaxID=693977 RepID=F0RQU9_DEIPM|nr:MULTISPECIES: Rrf2 family transcriptional regulator [Deinococcus]ADY27658.1 transcriptional regulator, BadM/Rrf2 family [Deinococcus proteolyticus MRP]MCY1703536.1 Rrf2 family transcriptional regulator [Deinococcus sp. SL84]